MQIALRDTPSTAVMTTKMTRLMQDLSVVLVGRDAANVAKAKRRTLDTLPAWRLSRWPRRDHDQDPGAGGWPVAAIVSDR